MQECLLPSRLILSLALDPGRRLFSRELAGVDRPPASSLSEEVSGVKCQVSGSEDGSPILQGRADARSPFRGMEQFVIRREQLGFVWGWLGFLRERTASGRERIALGRESIVSRRERFIIRRER